MRTKILLGVAISAALSACSLVNSFPSVKEDGGGGSGGNDGTGGKAQGGMGGETGGTGGGNPGTGGAPLIDPGLVVAFGNNGVKYGVYALSPQTGEELKRLENGDYPTGLLDAVQGGAHEAERDLWFLAKGTKIQAATFDRKDNEWAFDGTEQTIDPVDDFGRLFAENEVLAYFASVGGVKKLVAYDTSNPKAIEQIGFLDNPVPTIPNTNQLWSASAFPITGGLELFLLWRDCTTMVGSLCDIRLDRYILTKTEVKKSSTTGVVGQVDTSTANTNRGGVIVDRFNGNLVVVLPNETGSTGEGTIRRYGRTKFDMTGVSFERKYVQFAADMSRLAIEPCDGIVAIGSPLTDLVNLVPLVVSGGTSFNWSLGSNVHSVRYEPFTHSLIVAKAIGSDTGVVAGRLEGTATDPTAQKRSADWDPPTFVPQYGVVIADPAKIVCE